MHLSFKKIIYIFDDTDQLTRNSLENLRQTKCVKIENLKTDFAANHRSLNKEKISLSNGINSFEQNGKLMDGRRAPWSYTPSQQWIHCLITKTTFHRLQQIEPVSKTFER